MNFSNIYQDAKRAEAYAKLEFPGTYYLAYRDLPEIIRKHAKGQKALDFGCGAGRSTRFVRQLGYEVTGVDISSDMIQQARKLDPPGSYHLMKNGDFSIFEQNSFDLITSIFTFDNIPDADNRLQIMKGLANLIHEKGTIILLDSTPEIYYHEWASFSTKDFPENKQAQSGQIVQIIMTDVEDQRPVEDVIWFHEDYLSLLQGAGLQLTGSYLPLGNSAEPFAWKSEMEVAPWVIYVVNKNGTPLIDEPFQ